MGDIFVSTVYCDDVRQEIGGKYSIMGIYNSDLIVTSFPSTLTKLCVQVTIRFPIQTNAKNLVVKVMNANETLAEIPLPEGDLQAMRMEILKNDEEPDEVQFLGVAVNLQFPSLQVGQRAKIRSFAIVDGTEIKGNNLMVRLPTDAERADLRIPGI